MLADQHVPVRADETSVSKPQAAGRRWRLCEGRVRNLSSQPYVGDGRGAIVGVASKAFTTLSGGRFLNWTTSSKANPERGVQPVLGPHSKMALDFVADFEEHFANAASLDEAKQPPRPGAAAGCNAAEGSGSRRHGVKVCLPARHEQEPQALCFAAVT